MADAATPAKILVSACLLGQPVRYDGVSRSQTHAALERWAAEGRLIAICPEIADGFGVPRPPAEIAEGRSEADVAAGHGRVVLRDGQDVSAAFVAGAKAALALARQHDCRWALLVEGSPSCGSSRIYDGSFSGRQHPAAGVTAALLDAAGIELFSEAAIDALAAAVDDG